MLPKPEYQIPYHMHNSNPGCLLCHPPRSEAAKLTERGTEVGAWLSLQLDASVFELVVHLGFVRFLLR